MRIQQLGYQKWPRKSSNKIVSEPATLLHKNKDGINLLIGIASVIAAIASLVVGCNQYSLSKNDTSQQTQIDKLTYILDTIQEQNKIARIQTNQFKDILDTIQEQNKIARIQTNDLIQIATASKAQESLTTKVLAGVERQLDVNNQQLLLSKKIDSATTLQSVLKRQSDILGLMDTYDQILNIAYKRKFWVLDSLTYQKCLDIIEAMKNTMKLGFSNNLVLNDTIVGTLWSRYYVYLRKEELYIQQQYISSNGGPFYKPTGHSLYMRYKQFVNPMTERITILQKQVTFYLRHYQIEGGELPVLDESD